MRATALLELAQVVDPASATPMINEAAEIAVRCRSTPLIHRARGLGWEPTG